MGSAVNLSFSFRTPLTFYHLWAHSFKLLKVIPYGEPKVVEGMFGWQLPFFLFICNLMAAAGHPNKE